MEDWDREDLGEIFSENPNGYKFPAPEMSWEPPCYVELANPIDCPLDDQGLLWHRTAVVFHIDVLARLGVHQQLDEQISDAFQPMWGKQFASEWAKIEVRLRRVLQQKMNDVPTLFQPPLRLVLRNEFADVGLPTVLSLSPDLVDVYVAQERGKYRDYDHLRIHSSLQAPQEGYLWFDKRIPEKIRVEECSLWFGSLISKLPKKYRPTNFAVWLQKLAEHDKRLVRQTAQPHQSWLNRSKIVLVFGAEHRPIESHMYHLYRDEIRTFRRFGNILELCSEREIRFTSDNRIFRSRFILICHDDDAAAATEYAMQAATKVYFGLGEGIKGIIHRLEDSIDAVGADEALIRKYCCSADEELDPFFPSRHRRKFYSIRRKQA